MKSRFFLVFFVCCLSACVSTPPVAPPSPVAVDPYRNEREVSPAAWEVVMHALNLSDIGYQFGGKNPEAGLDCSGLVTYVYRTAVGMQLAGNAAWLARQGKEVPMDQLRAGDLVFFNTLGRPFSHVGIYLGKGEFIHAPNSRSRVRIDKLTQHYWAQRFETARTLLD